MFIVKIFIISFTLYHFIKNRKAHKFANSYEHSYIATEDNTEIKIYMDLLGIKNNFDLASLKIAYRKQVKSNHPDIFKNKKDKINATNKMLKINEAYHILSEYLQNQECLQS